MTLNCKSTYQILNTELKKNTLRPRSPTFPGLWPGMEEGEGERGMVLYEGQVLACPHSCKWGCECQSSPQAPVGLRVPVPVR